MQKSPSQQIPLDVAQANRLFYRDLADKYDSVEDCVVNPQAHARLFSVLGRALELAGPGARVLDACGGTGYASGVLVELGARPVTVDLSPEMLKVWVEKARGLGYEAQTVEAEILTFLRTNEETWDLIVFSSALHHLENYLTVVKNATGRLRRNGVLVTIFDPTQVTGVGRVIRRLDYVTYVCLKHPGDALRKARAKLGGRRGAEANVGRIAEFHADRGIDDRAIHRTLEQEGLDIVAHDRLYDARLAIFRWLLRLFRIPSNFGFIARRPDEAPGAS